jgi:hypothetical protein
MAMTLNESDPEEIRRRCAQMRTAGPAEVRELTRALIHLDTSRLPAEVADQVFDSLLFGIFGTEHAAGAEDAEGQITVAEDVPTGR